MNNKIRWEENNRGGAVNPDRPIWVPWDNICWLQCYFFPSLAFSWREGGLVRERSLAHARAPCIISRHDKEIRCPLSASGEDITLYHGSRIFYLFDAIVLSKESLFWVWITGVRCLASFLVPMVDVRIFASAFKRCTGAFFMFPSFNSRHYNFKKCHSSICPSKEA